MRVIFVGSGELGLPALKRLAKDAVLVVTSPDQPAGRGLKVRSTPVKDLAFSLNLPVLETADINHPETLAKLQSRRPEIILVAAFGQILEKPVLELPEKAALNIHPSLLPKYRGAAPIERTILNKEKETGVTIIKVTERMDAGPILVQEMIPVLPDDDADTLGRRLAELGADLAEKGLEQIEEGSVAFTAQDETKATYAPKIARQEGLIDWNKDAAEIDAKVRAFIRWPRAYTYLPPTIPPPQGGEEKGKAMPPPQRGEGLNKRTLIIWKSVPVDETRQTVIKSGTVIKADQAGILVACGNGDILITELQAAGKKRIAAGEFIRGFRFTENTVLG